MAQQDLLYLLDACSLLNLVASRRFTEIADGTAARFATSEQAAAEVRYVRRGGSGPDANERDPVDLSEICALGLLTVSALETPAELATFVDLALEMDDGEAASGALAIHRGGTLVTDDRKARRVLSQRASATPLLTTSQVVRAWSDHMNLPPPDLAALLIAIEERGRFRPGRHDPLFDWWNSALIQK